jgi:putative serine protease PepD
MSSEDFPRNQDSVDRPSADSGPYADAAQPAVTEGSGRPAQPNDTQDTGPVQVPPAAPYGTDTSSQVAPIWQPRPSGALSAEAWSNPASTAGYPSGAAGQYNTGQYRPQDQYGQYSDPRSAGLGGPHPGTGQGQYAAQGYSTSGYGAQTNTGQYYAGYGQAPAVGGASAPASAGSGGPTGTLPGRRRRYSMLVAATVVIALGGAFGAGYLGSQVGASTATSDSSISQRTTSPVVSDSQPVVAGSTESVAAKLLPSVVSILAISPAQDDEGSGVILSSDGLILTNNHVIAGATDLTVKFNDGTTAAAKVVGADATDDLAVIKVSGVSGLTVATIGSSANVKVGEQVVAVGSPLGLSATVTSGIVSALNRPVRTAAEKQQGQNQGQTQTPTQDTVLNAIQTDAAINPGNSGGALVDMTGAVIGINSAIASLSSSSSSSQSGSIGVGFAIPIDQAHRIAQEIINTGHATHAVLGASVGDAPDGTSADAQAATQAGLSIGAKIASVVSGGAAAAAGLQANDVITKIGGVVVGSADALIATIRSSAPGGKVEVTYLRGSSTMTATVTLGSAVSN